MNISFTEKQNGYIAAQVKAGDDQNASEVVRDALRSHEVYRQKIIEDLRTEVAKGWIENTSNKTIRDIIEVKTEKK